MRHSEPRASQALLPPLPRPHDIGATLAVRTSRRQSPNATSSAPQPTAQSTDQSEGALRKQRRALALASVRATRAVWRTRTARRPPPMPQSLDTVGLSRCTSVSRRPISTAVRSGIAIVPAWAAAASESTALVSSTSTQSLVGVADRRSSSSAAIRKAIAAEANRRPVSASP